MASFLNNYYLKFDESGEIELNRCSRDPLPLKEELLETAKTIYKEAKKSGVLPITVHLSGGLDSEILLRTFLEASVPIRVSHTSLIYNGNSINSYETECSSNLCKELGVELNVVETDMMWLLIDKTFEYIEMFGSDHVMLGTTLFNWMYEQAFKETGGMSVAGNKDMFIHNSEEGLFIQEFKNRELFKQKHSQYVPFVDAFFRYSPEIILSYLNNEKVKSYMDLMKETGTVDHILRFKHSIWHSTFPNIKDKDPNRMPKGLTPLRNWVNIHGKKKIPLMRDYMKDIGKSLPFKLKYIGYSIWENETIVQVYIDRLLSDLKRKEE